MNSEISVRMVLKPSVQQWIGQIPALAGTWNSNEGYIKLRKFYKAGLACKISDA